VLAAEDFTLQLAPREAGRGIAAIGGLVVVRDLTANPALVAEGKLRDLNRGVQDLRKSARLAYADRIELALHVSDELWAIVEHPRRREPVGRSPGAPDQS
jgi:isoleucyl-tRNA synthetase